MSRNCASNTRARWSGPRSQRDRPGDQRGECFGLLGPNGAGKTTTVEILEGLNTPTSGEVEILGLRWATDEVAIRERIGVTLQETRLPDKETVHEMVLVFRSFYRRASPDDAINRVSLESKSNSLIEQLSGGQKQRLAVAIALVGDPEVLFLDEPTTGLDPQSRRQLWDVIRDLRDRGSTVLLTTHYMDEAESLCDRVAVIDQGKIIAQGSPLELIARLGGDHIVEFAIEGDGNAPGARGSFPGLDSVLSARTENEGYALTVSEPHRAIPALLDELNSKAAHGPLDDPPRQPRRRFRRADRPASSRRLEDGSSSAAIRKKSRSRRGLDRIRGSDRNLRSRPSLHHPMRFA